MSITECFRKGGVKTRNYASAFALAAVLTAAAFAPFASSAGSATLKCAGYTGTETLTDFQALICLADGRYGFKYADCADQTAGTDVWFSSDAAGNNVLEREIDTWNPDGSSYIWVKIPSLAAGTEITMHWGDASKAQPTANTAVWTGYAGVWHMGKASGAETEPDATGHGLDATPNASLFANNNGNTSLMITAEDGIAGGSRVNTTAGNICNALKVTSCKSKLDNFHTFTVGGWFYQTVRHPGWNRFFCSRPATKDGGADDGWDLTSPNNGSNNGEIPSGVDANEYLDCFVGRVYAGNSSSKSKKFLPTVKTAKVENVVGRWVHYCVSFSLDSDGNSPFKVYVDGVQVNEGTIPADCLPKSDNNFWIGRYGDRGNSFIGRYDEVRMYNGAMSADRVKADYDTAYAPAKFFTVAPSAAKSATLKCAGYTGTETLTDFQALIKLDEGRYGFSYFDCADPAEGTDVWFSSDAAGNNVLACEIDTWNPGGSSYIWVKIPSLVRGTKITMHWGDADAAAAAKASFTAADVWTGFAGVWHMGKASGATPEPDASGNGLDAVPTETTLENTTTYPRDLSEMIPDGGMVGKSRINKTTSTLCQGLKVPDFTGKVSNQSVFSVCGWFYATSTPNNWRLFCSRPVTGYPNVNRAVGWDIQPYNGSSATKMGFVQQQTASSTSGKETVVSAVDVSESIVGRWVYVCTTWNGTGSNGVKSYVDGALLGQGKAIGAVANSDYGMMIGMYGTRATCWYGRYDELRMYNGVLSAARVKADYDTMNASETFFSLFQGVATAEWTGAAENGSVADAGNWLCKDVAGNVIEDVLPTIDTDVTVSGNAVDMQAPSGTTLQYSTIAIGNCTLTADCDWRGLGNVEIAGTVALGGHTLTLADTKGSGTITGEGKLVVDVAEGKTVTNGSLALSGALQLEKTGEGTFTASKTSQTYTGGTVVSGGTFIPGANGTSRTTGASGSQITVGSGGVFNLNGKCDFYDYGFVLDGGALKADASSSTPSENPCIASVTLIADSSFILDAHFGLINKKVNNAYAQVNLDLRGHTLTLHGGRALYMTNVKATQGRIVATGETFTGSSGGLYGTRINCHASPASDLSAVELVMNGHSAVYVLASPLKIGAYECNSTYYVDNSGYAGQMYVYGRFAPNTDRFYGATLQSGATLDLRARTGCFNTTGSGHTANTARCTLGFASGAAITVNLAGRTDLGAIAKSDLPLVVQWATEPNATFTLDPETAKRFKLVKCAIETTDGETTTTVRGLRLRYKPGLIITVW